MVLQGCCRWFLVSILFLVLLTPSDAAAQPQGATVVFVPFGAPTEYAPQTRPQLVANRSSCGACSQAASASGSMANQGVVRAPVGEPTLATGTQIVGGMVAPQHPIYGGSNSPVYGQVDSTNYGNGGGCRNGNTLGNGYGYGSSGSSIGYGDGYGDGCPPASFVQPRQRAAWYASAAGLYLSRSESRRVWTTYENNNNANQLMNTQDADTDFEVGADLRIGRFLAGNRWAVELGYWSIDNFNGSASQSHVNEVSSPLQFNDLEFAPGDPVVDYFDSAADHRVYRSNELHNVELNLIEGRAASSGCSPWSHQMLVGVRYFKFDEDLTFDTLNSGGTWGGNGGLDEVRLRDSIQNDLIGAQVGCIFQRQLGCKTRLVVAPKFGIYNNHIENRFDLRRGDGSAALPSAASGVTGGYPVESSTDVVSFLSEANVGLQYQASCRWALFGGYRVVAITGMGLADEQIPQFIIDIPEIADIDTTGCLVLHGAYFGATRSF